MLKTIKDTLFLIVDFFATLFDLVFDLIRDIIYIIQAVGKAIASLPQLFSWLPSSLFTLVITIFSVFVIYKIIGRD